MTKKLSAIHKRFNPVARANRAIARAEAILADSAAKAARENILNDTIFPSDSQAAYLRGSPDEVTFNDLDGKLISWIEHPEPQPQH